MSLTQPVLGNLTPDMPFSTLITPHISYGEFALNQESRRFTETYQCQTAYVLCLFLELCRDNFGGNSLIITSGYRPPAVNRRVGGARQSEHLFDQPDVGAVDFYIKNVSIHTVEKWCNDYYPYSLGYGADKGFVHLGIRKGRPRIRWDY